MRRLEMTKRRAAGVLVAGGLSVAAVLGASGVASAAGGYFEVTGDSSTPQGAKDIAHSNAHDACVKVNGSGSYLEDTALATITGNPDGTYWVASITVKCQ
ncbi:hypothetical protein OK074_7398 [Actinobacteria bacterium OK074]|nr:hypothetical protein OK074_7398 [Actinobacteria bacterium OK074]